MKKLLLIFAIVAAIPTFATRNDDGSPADFKITKYSFGKIPQSKPVTTAFTFTNISDKPLVIEVATAECGCTTPDYPKTPILKGKTGIIKVTYNAANLGSFTKNVTVKFANIASPIILTIEGEVVQK